MQDVKPLAIGAAAVLAIGAVVFFLASAGMPADPADAPAGDAPAADPARDEPARVPARPAPDARAPVAAPPAVPRAALPAAPTRAALILTTDVPGASVFINREYAGATPLRLDALEPGRAQLKLTADGYEGVDRTVDLAAGENAVTVRFREVRLHARIPVVHRHRLGSCDGTLIATVDGLAYETPNADDAFVLPHAEVEIFAVDYLEKNLRVKQARGRTWNFTDPRPEGADALLVFHRNVEAARRKLAEGYAPVR